MEDLNNAHQNEIQVEDLLRLKRSERPDGEFWDTFDSELHQRMLQALVKKDPWYIQILRGISGRLAQTTAVGLAAIFLAMIVVRPALVDSSTPSEAYLAEDEVKLSTLKPIEVAMAEFDTSLTPDYQIEAISGNLEYTSDYELDSFEVASYGTDAYVADTASFATTNVATGLVY